jgi:hypothetical protein
VFTSIGGHRLGLVQHQVAAGLQRHLALQRARDLVLDAVQVEDRPRLRVFLDLRFHLRDEARGEALHAPEDLRVVDPHPLDARRQQVAQQPQRQVEVGVHQRARRAAPSLRMRPPPRASEEQHVGAQGVARRALGGGAHDPAAAAVRGDVLHDPAQARPLLLVLDARRHADAAAERQMDTR